MQKIVRRGEFPFARTEIPWRSRLADNPTSTVGKYHSNRGCVTIALSLGCPMNPFQRGAIGDHAPLALREGHPAASIGREQCSHIRRCDFNRVCCFPLRADIVARASVGVKITPTCITRYRGTPWRPRTVSHRPSRRSLTKAKCWLSGDQEFTLIVPCPPKIFANTRWVPLTVVCESVPRPPQGFQLYSPHGHLETNFENAEESVLSKYGDDAGRVSEPSVEFDGPASHFERHLPEDHFYFTLADPYIAVAFIRIQVKTQKVGNFDGK